MNIALFLPTCVTTTTNPRKIITTKLMLTTWKKNTFALLPTCATIAPTPSPIDCATNVVASSFLV
jgi:hypothetical protein